MSNILWDISVVHMFVLILFIASLQLPVPNDYEYRSLDTV